MPPASRESHRHQRFESHCHIHPSDRRYNHRSGFHSSIAFDPASPSIPPQNSNYQGKRYDPNYIPRKAQWDRGDRVRKSTTAVLSTKDAERSKAKSSSRPPQEGGLERQEAIDRKLDWKENSRAGRSHAQDSVASCLTILKDTPDKADISASVKTTLSQTQHSYASSPSALPGNPELKATDEIESPSDRPRGQNLLATELSFTCNSTTEQQKSGPTKLPSLQSNEDKSREPASEGLGLSSEFDIATPTLEGKSRSPISPPASTTSDLPESHKEPSSCEQALPPDAPHIQFSFAHSTLGIAFAREMNALCSETKKQYIRMDDLLWQLEHQGKERHEASLQMMQVAQELQHQRTMVLQKDLESKRSETLAAMAKANQEIAQFREQTAKANEERSQAREEMFKNRIELQRAQWRIKDLEQTIRVLENRCGVPYSSRTETTL